MSRYFLHKAFGMTVDLGAPSLKSRVFAAYPKSLASLYAQAIAKSGDPASIKLDQCDWRKSRDDCADAACLQASYERRHEQLTG